MKIRMKEFCKDMAYSLVDNSLKKHLLPQKHNKHFINNCCLSISQSNHVTKRPESHDIFSFYAGNKTLILKFKLVYYVKTAIRRGKIAES